jgi:hypothetical protein
MHALTSYPGHMVFSKTPRGHEEITHRRFGLTMRQRRVLILIDGVKDFSAVQGMVPKEDLEEIITFLVEENFVATAEAVARGKPGLRRASPSPHAAVSDRPEQPAPVENNEAGLLPSPEKIREIKDFMTTTATTYLGLLSADVIHRIERAKSAAQLMNVVGYWHMALRESKQGNRFAGPYLEQVTAALTGEKTPSGSLHP